MKYLLLATLLLTTSAQAAWDSENGWTMGKTDNQATQIYGINQYTGSNA